MSQSGFQAFINLLEKNNELVRISSFVDPLLEIAEITDRISKQTGGGKALLFENTGTRFPVITNAFGSEKRICLALGVPSLDQAVEQFMQLISMLQRPSASFWEKLKILPSLSALASYMPREIRGKGACQQNILPNADLSLLPILKTWPFDGGRFVTLPMVHTIDPESGIRNVGMYRMQEVNNHMTGMHWQRHKTGARHFDVYKRLNKKMPIAVTLGGDPIYTYAATAPLPDPFDEYILAGIIRKKRVELVHCLTQDICVPADVDIVIEGYVDPAEELFWEGPFGDHTGFYSLADWYPKFHVTCITHSNDAVYPATLVGIPPQEDAWLAKATERIFLAPVKLAIAPEVVDFCLPEEGVAHNLAIVSIDKRYPGQAKKVMSALWGAGQMMFTKVIIVVDKQVDVSAYHLVLDAIKSNVNLPDDLVISQGPSDVLDHASSAFSYGGKLGIDATVKLKEENSTAAVVSQHFSEPAICELFKKQNIDNLSLNWIENRIILIEISKENGEIKPQLEKAISDNPNFFYQKNIILVDPMILSENASIIVWHVLANLDPARDITISNQSIIVDGRTKIPNANKVQHAWPSIVTMDKKTIHAIDDKWETLSIGPFIPSPTLSFERIKQSDSPEL